jgi:surfactin synthase thioesterase subunit
MAEPWIRRPRPRPEARVRLLCVPPAGAGPSFFARWAVELPAAVEVCLAHLPGRESRLRELPLDDLAAIAERLGAEARDLLDRPLALFGHSVGAIIAFEVAHALRTRTGEEVRHLFASASGPPHLETGERPIGHLPDAEFVEAVQMDYGGIPAALLEDPDALRPLLPALRADFIAFERHRHVPRPPLGCPISALGGRADPSVSEPALTGWGELTTGRFRVRLFDGDHFYVAGARAAVLAGVCEDLGLDSPPEVAAAGGAWRLLRWSAASQEELDALLATGLADLARDPDAPLPASERRAGALRHRAALVARGRREAVAALRNRTLLAGCAAPRPLSPAFLLGGVGDHYPGMGRELYREEPVFRDALDRCCSALGDRGEELRAALRLDAADAPAAIRDPRALVGSGLDQGALERTRLGQPAVFVVEYALAELLAAHGLRPAAMLGYSLGEYVAACLAGVMSMEDAVRLVQWRAERIEELPEGAMVALPFAEDQVGRWLSPELQLAAVNSRVQCVVGGPVAAVADLERRLTEERVAHRRVGTRHAFHTRMMEPLGTELTGWVRANVRLREPRIPYVSNLTGAWISAAEAVDPSYWARHLCQTVRLMDGLGALWEEPTRVMLELGPGQSLCVFARHHPRCGRARLAAALPTLPYAHERDPEPALLLGSLARLWVAGVDTDRSQREEES